MFWPWCLCPNGNPPVCSRKAVGSLSPNKALSTKVNGIKDGFMDKASTVMLMAKFMKDSGKMTKNMGNTICIDHESK